MTRSTTGKSESGVTLCNAFLKESPECSFMIHLLDMLIRYIPKRRGGFLHEPWKMG